MMPAGTAPNALVFASGQVTMRQMMRAGFLLDLACAALIPPLVVALLHAGLLPGT
jgi:sodium-dependent dicarboxylate transporter 2/3/5